MAGTGVGGHSGDGGQATSAKLNYFYGVAMDASGNIYVADTGNNCTRMVTKSTGVITTGVAVDASGNIYIADTGNQRIRMVTKSTGVITTVAVFEPSPKMIL